MAESSSSSPQAVAGIAAGAARIVAAVRGWQATCPGPVVVAIDGHGASGKTTLAQAAAGRLEAALVHTDDFYRDAPAGPLGAGAAGPLGAGAARPHGAGAARPHGAGAARPLGAGAGGGPAPMARYYDWERLRAEGLLPELAAGSSEAHRAGAPATKLVLIEGVSSASPALADLVTHTVLVVTPEPVRLGRLRARIRAEEWDEDWLTEERVYFASRPVEAFDLVVPGDG